MSSNHRGGKQFNRDPWDDWRRVQEELTALLKVMRARRDNEMKPKINAAISFDETKPHWAEQQGLDKEAALLGMTVAYIGGDFDMKYAVIYGHVDSLEAFKAAAADSRLSHGSVYRVAE